MTSIELKERLEKAQATVEKKAATIERHRARAEKLLAEIKAKGLEVDRYKYRGTEDYWLICDYENKLDDIENAGKKLEEAKQIAQNWEKKLEAQIEREKLIENEIPEAMKAARADLVESWVSFDIRSREAMIALKKKLDYTEFRKKYTYIEEQDLTHTDDEFRKIEEREADYWLLNLYNRVKEITGEVTDCSGLRWGGKCLDGIVKGKEGIAVVNTIEAGGYNIQRWHLRVLVKAYK